MERPSRCRTMLLTYITTLCLLPFALAADASLSLEKNVISAADKTQELEILLTPPQKELKQVTVDALIDTDGKEVLSGLDAKGDGGKFHVSLSGKDKLEPGLYKLKVSASPKSAGVITNVLSLKMTTPVEIVNAKINDESVAVGDKLKHSKYSSSASDSLSIEFQVQNSVTKKAVSAHQAMLHFHDAETNTEAYFVLLPKQDMYVTTINFAMLHQKFKYTSGKYNVHLFLGDATFDKSMDWDLGAVTLEFPEAPAPAPSPLYSKPLLHDSDTAFHALPEIKHVMRPEDPRPPFVVSAAFTAAVLVPLLVFIGFVFFMGANVNKLFDGSILVSGTGFLLSLTAIFALFAWYWLELTMYQTLVYLAGVGSLNLWFGHLTLKRLANKPSSGKTYKVE